MDSPPPEDPYAALGVAKDATTANIKTVYRKLVLKHHPDKVQDETKKQAAADQFNKIQQAYKLLSDDTQRRVYDASAKLDELRKEVGVSRHETAASTHPRDASYTGSTVPRSATAAYDHRTSPGVRGATFDARGSARFSEERKSNYAYEDGPYHEDIRVPSSRYDDHYNRSKARTSPRGGRRVEPEPDRLSRKENEKNSRFEKSRTSDRERRKDRDIKYAHVEPQEIDPYDEAYRNADKARARERELEHEQIREETRRARARGDQDITHDYDRQYKYRAQEDNVKEYTRQSNSSSAEPESRPAMSRSTSAKEVPYSHRSPSDARPSMARRSSSRRTTNSPPRRGRKEGDKKSPLPEIVEERRRPNLSTSYTSPAGLEDMVGGVPPRSYNAQVVHPHEPVHPSIRRAETMPTYTAASGRGKGDAGRVQPGKTRETHQDSGYSSPSSAESDSFPDAPQYPQPKGTQHYFSSPVFDEPQEFGNGFRTQRVDPPSSHRKRSPSPREHRSRPSSRRQHDAPSTPIYKTTQYQYPSSTTAEPPTSAPSSVHPAEAPRRPSLPRRDAYHSSSRNGASSTRDPYSPQSGSTRNLFGEGGAGTTGATEYKTVPVDYRTADATPTGSGKSSKNSATAQMMTGLAAKSNVQYSKRPQMEDIRTSNPMGSKVRPSAHRKGSSAGHRPGAMRRESVRAV